VESPNSQQQQQQHQDMELSSRRQNGSLSSSYFVRQSHPFVVDSAAGVGGSVGGQPARASRPRLIETSIDDVLLGGNEQLEQQFHRTLLRVERMMRSNDARAAERDRQTSVRAEWQLVATVVDRILLVIFVATTVGVTLVVLFSAPHAFEFMLGTGPPDAALLDTASTSPNNHST